eukprot:TRINITY_DN229_c2_g1_i1.p1 TRINITY_DN229_c2_g1~~TRINITY_DN229_c2_g1_i1.p1  ORF type:complete len:289 (-),score=41.72 TRINITY_DN229_c2_g1_i1:54-920(-)
MAMSSPVVRSLLPLALPILLLLLTSLHYDYVQAGPAEKQCSKLFTNATPPSGIKAINSTGFTVGLCHSADSPDGTSYFLYNLYDTSVMHSLYSAYMIKASLRSRGGRRSFSRDPQLVALDIPQVDPTGFNGYGNDWNRGHLGPSQVFGYDQSSGGPWAQCYYSTNIAPQSGRFNQVGWRLLESACYDWTAEQDKDLYVITGTWYNQTQGQPIKYIDGPLGVPDYYYKIICNGNESAAFAGQNILGNTGYESLNYMSVNQWEATTGISFNLSSQCNPHKVNPDYWGFSK